MRTPVTGALYAALALSQLLLGCGGEDRTLLEGVPAGAPPALSPPGNAGPGLDVAPRGTPFLSLPKAAELAAPGWVAVEAFPNLTFDDPVALVAAPHTGQLFVAEREGRLYAFENRPDADARTLVLDLAEHTQGEDDSGLLGLVFHPEFGEPGSPNAGYVYLHYALSQDPVSRPAAFTPTVSRLARFTVDLDTLVADPASELVLIDQSDDSPWHQGGAMFFHPADGFLYLAVGDEGPGHCFFDNCQRIDKDLFSGVLRLDVDMRGGSISHPIPRQPQTGATANYYIPNDNPFVGRPGVLEEFYAIGLRSPHRMTYDPLDDIAFIGDVGQSTREEIDVLAREANYQWNVLEGLEIADVPKPEAPLGVWTSPLLDLARQEAASVIGGYVYRGSRLPALYGKYVFGDHMTGNIWALSYAHDAGQTRLIDRELLVTTGFRNLSGGITSFGVDDQQELYILTLGRKSKIHRLDSTPGFSNAPPRLSETGAFTDLAALEPSAGLVPYSVLTPLWSDGASKQRWTSLPAGQPATFSEAGPWRFAPGTVFVKHFEILIDAADPTSLRRLETRFLVAQEDGGYYGLTYKWNEDQTDAELLLQGQTDEIELRRSNGELERLNYYYPSPGDCLVCHNAPAGFVLGVQTAQLNADLLYTSTQRVANQLFTWSHAGLLDQVLDEAAVEPFAALAPLSDEAAPLEHRVRSYWASNCSMCHGGAQGLKATWDARFSTPLAEQGIVWGQPINGTSTDGTFLVVPGDTSRSLLYERSTTNIPGWRMPPLGRSTTDPLYAKVLEQWIISLGDAPPPP
jgi:uncharacterized repeat protein (TIGR03806 family)